MSYQRKITYPAGLFHRDNLNSLDNIVDSLSQFESVINEHNYVQALSDFWDDTHIVELILSGMSDIPLNKWIVKHFPTDINLFESSFESKLLHKLSEFHIFATAPDGLDYNVLRDYYRTVSLAPEALQTLSSAISSFKLNEEELQPESSFKKGKAKNQKQKTKHTPVQEINKRPLIDVNIAIPRTSSDAQAALTKFLGCLREILEFYLNKMISPQIAKSIKDGFIAHDRPELTIMTDAGRLPIDTPDTPVPAVPTTENLPISPMKSALFFDSPKGFGAWRILVSQDAHSDLRYFLRRSKKSFNIITKKIRDISNGHFSEDNQKWLNRPSSTDVPVFEAKMSRDLRLVYMVDCDATGIQVLKLFRIMNHAQIKNRSWEDVGRALGKRGKEYRDSCKKRVRVSNSGNVYSPACCSSEPVDSPSPTPPIDVSDLPEEDSNEVHKIVTLEKYVTFSRELLDSIKADRDDLFPFEISQKEQSIVDHPHSCYVLGRSGTGKTTTMLFKMLGIERAYSMFSEDLAHPRQVFITKSRVLVRKVEEHFFKYLESLNTGSSGHQNTFQRIRDCDVLDDGFTFNENDNEEWRSDLPQRYSELEDNHFPLFITFDALCKMLEADIYYKDSISEGNDRALTRTLPLMSGHRTSALRPRGKLVDHDRFVSEYWPHFPQSLTKKLDASAVFSEIIGVISGSERTASFESGYLDRDTYENSHLRSQSKFAGHFSRIYDIFLSYHQRKMELGDFDAAERTHTILRSFARAPFKLLAGKKLGDFDAAERTHAILRSFARAPLLAGKKFDYLYVDETQDNLLIDALLLRSLSRSPNGLFWAGDTAQTISAGSSFRFDDLKAFLYTIEKAKPDKFFGSIKRPLTFHLAINYRSHAGIVNCAHTVIELITLLWPNSIDKLKAEQGGVVNGVKPVFYTDVDPDFIKEGRFLSRSTSREKIELGANQCILVRNDKARDLLINEIGKVGIILTIYESKGLEFNDVFLYNFFHDSECDASQWRVVLNGIDAAHATGMPVFDAIKHIGICSELKSLYVAITRARNNLRIADFSTKGESMRELWLSRGQIQNCLPGNEISDFAATSSKDEWGERAMSFFNLQQYVLAKDSFMRANNFRMAAVSNAYALQGIAKKMPNHHSTTRTRPAAFESAAQAFLVCARDAQDSGSDKYKNYYQLAAKCFEESGNITKAAENYRVAENFTKATLLFRKSGKFDDAYDIITNHSDKVTPDDRKVLEGVKDVIRLYYLREKKYQKAHALFTTVEEEIGYLEDRNLDDAHVDLLIRHEKKSDAAEVHLSEGRILQAIDLFLDDKENRQDSIQRATDCVLQGLRKAMPLGGSLAGLEITELLKRSDLLYPCMPSQDDRDEIDMFKAISSGCKEGFIRRANTFLNSGNMDAALLCLDRQFEHTPDFTNMNIPEMACALQLFLRYTEMLQNFAFSVDPCAESHIWTLFGYRPHEHGDFWIPAGTLLYAQASREASVTTSEAGLILSREKLFTTYQECLKSRLLDRVTMENDKCRVAPALNPCLDHVVYGDCKQPICNGVHIFPDEDWFNTWTRVHLLQIQIYHTIIHLQFSSEMKSQQRYWVGKLHQVLNASDFRFGSYSNLDDQTIADARKPLNVVIDWVRQVAVSLEHDWPPQLSLLTHAMVTANIAFTFDRNDAAVYLYRSEFIHSEDCPEQYFRRPYGENCLQEFLVALHEKGPSSIVNGILFIRQVMEAKIPVEIGIFCSFIERICGSLIVYNRYQRTGSLHGVTLPRSWLKVIMDTFQSTEKDASRFWLLLQPLEELLRTLYYINFSNPGHLLYGLRFWQAERQRSNIRSLYIARICRALGLLGYNIQVQAFKDKIFCIFRSLLESDHHGFSPLYGRYIYAEDFSDIAKVTRRSMQGSPLDEMVELLQSDRIQSPVHEIFGLRRVTYATTEEIPSLLAGLPSQHLSSSQMSSSDLSSGNSSLGVNDLEEENAENDHIDDALNAADEIMSDQEEDPDFIPQMELPEDIHARHSDDEKHAATIIQRFYRRLLEQRQLRNQTGPEGQNFFYYFHLCWKRVREENRKSDKYTKAFLGPLPHLLSSLDSAESLTMAKKREMKKQLVNEQVTHEALDEVSSILSRIPALLKGIKECRKNLHPTADTHRDHDLDLLKKHVGHAVDLLSDLYLPFEVTYDLRVVGLFHKALILQEKVEVEPPKTSRKEKRPKLNMDDDDNDLFSYLDSESESNDVDAELHELASDVLL